MDTVTGFLWPTPWPWELLDELHPALAARYAELERADLEWMMNFTGQPVETAAQLLAPSRMGRNPRHPEVWILPYDESLYVLDVRGDYREALASIEGLADHCFGPEDPQADEAAQDLRRMNIGVWQEAVPEGDYSGHGLRVGLPADAGLPEIRAALPAEASSQRD